MAKSKLASGCGRDSVSATTTLCGGWRVAILARLVDLSEAMM